jgi:hypothetical protein
MAMVPWRAASGDSSGLNGAYSSGFARCICTRGRRHPRPRGTLSTALRSHLIPRGTFSTALRSHLVPGSTAASLPQTPGDRIHRGTTDNPLRRTNYTTVAVKSVPLLPVCHVSAARRGAWLPAGLPELPGSNPGSSRPPGGRSGGNSCRGAGCFRLVEPRYARRAVAAVDPRTRSLSGFRCGCFEIGSSGGLWPTLRKSGP